MDEMRMHFVRESISDAIGILDSAPIQSSMFPQMNLLRVTSRIPIAHLAIERGLKALIMQWAEENSSTEISKWLDCRNGGRTHDLGRLYSKLNELDKEPAQFLARAFDDAVNFFGYSKKRNGYKHFKSVESYFSLVATNQIFEAMRYWVLENKSGEEGTILRISPPIHREVLSALWCLFLPNLRQTVSERVELGIARALTEDRSFYFAIDSEEREKSIAWYQRWLDEEHSSYRGALKDAAERNFDAGQEDEIISRVLQEAWNDLNQSDDPAIRYFLNTLAYHAEGSQPEPCDAVPVEKWSDSDRHSGEVLTPAGKSLGAVYKLADGAWGVIPFGEDLVNQNFIAWKLKDAKNCLINGQTSRVLIRVDGQSWESRIVGKRSVFRRARRNRTQEIERGMPNLFYEYSLEFWDVDHGLAEATEMSFVTFPEGESNVVTVLTGRVTHVDAQRVTIKGRDILDVWKSQDD